MKEYIAIEKRTDNGGYIEVVGELIRCKDCAKRSFTKCPMAIGRQSDDDYCSRAKRKEE